ncbi:MAG: YceI family protein [Myxococcota bacterium]|nr:YceI family protein [Myxococcota bacterium]
MKFNVLIFSAASILMGLSPVLAQPTTIKFKGNIQFISDAPMERIEGTAPATGEFNIDKQSLGSITGKASVSVAGMKTGNDQRDEHLRSDTWLDEKQFPEITFVIKSASANGELKKDKDVSTGTVTLNGDLSLHGVTKSISTKADVKWKGDKYKIMSKFQVKLADYKVEGATGIVGSKVGKTIDITVSLRGKGN